MVVVLLLGVMLAVLEDRTDAAAALVWEGVGEDARACGDAGVCVVSWRGMSVRRSPVWSTEGELMGNIIWYPGRAKQDALTSTKQQAMAVYAKSPAPGESRRGPRACP